MTAVAEWFAQTLGQYISPEWVVFIISMIPILELRGGLIAASILDIPILKAIPFCIAGNIVPIPFILLFIKKILKWMQNIKGLRVIAGLKRKQRKRAKHLEKVNSGGLRDLSGFRFPVQAHGPVL